MTSLYVAICADTEDNPPNYVPGWQVLGSDYDVNPAIIRFDWTKFWDSLIRIFRRNQVPITWLFRVDDGPVEDLMLKKFEPRIFDLKSRGDEIGIHIHTWTWDSKSYIWRQTKDHNREYEIVKRSIRTFRRCLGFSPICSRMGWSNMSNEIMRALQEEDMLVDASCEPGYKCDGMYGGRDNIVDWSKAGQDFYHPNRNDYQLPGETKLLEIPISSLSEGKRILLEGLSLDKLTSLRLHTLIAPLLPLVSRLFESFQISAYNIFYISPLWSTSIIKKIINSYVENAETSQDSFLVGFFHPSDILEPVKGTFNKNFAEKIEYIIKYITLQRKKVKLSFITLSEMAKIYMTTNAHAR